MSGVLTVPAAVPAAPTITGLTAGSGTLGVAFTAPASNGGTAITNSSIRPTAASPTPPFLRPPSPARSLISGLGNGTTYTVRIRAVNSAGGDGTPSNSVAGTPVNSYLAWANANAGGQAANLDSNKNGIPNGIEYFMGATAANPAAMPALLSTNGTLAWTWPYHSTAAVTYKFQLSADLYSWTDVTPPESRITVLANPNRIRFTLSTTTPGKFCRLVVTPMP